MVLRDTRRWVRVGLLFGLLGTACQGATLRELGAAGDGLRDDTQALQSALADPLSGALLDGEGLRYRVRGTLRVARDMQLVRTHLIQDDAPAHGEGPPGTRTLLFAGTPQRPLRIRLHDVSVHRGSNPHQGSPGGSAGIWLAHVADSRLEDVEVTGNGRGVGVLVVDSHNVEILNPRIHDMVWAPCMSQVEGLPADALRSRWNSYEMVPMDDCTRAASPRVRIREPLAGIVIARSQRIRVVNARIARLLARLSDGHTLAWQTDGITVRSDLVRGSQESAPTEVLIENARIEQVWEGIDLMGQPLTDARVVNARIEDTHAFGVKVANGATQVVVDGAKIRRSGMAGVVVSGSANRGMAFPPTNGVSIRNTRVVDTGAGGLWKGQAVIAGVRIMKGAVGGPTQVSLLDSQSIDRQTPPTTDFGLHAECWTAADAGLRSRGHGVAIAHVETADCD